MALFKKTSPPKKEETVTVESKDVVKMEDVLPRIAEGVAIAVAPSSPELKDLADICQKAMSDAVLKCISEGVTDPVIQKERMMEAHARVEREWGRK